MTEWTHQAQQAQQFGEPRLAELLREHFKIAPEDLRADVTLRELKLDSLDLMELLVMVESETGVELLDVSPVTTGAEGLELQGKHLSLGPSTTLAEAGRMVREAVESAADTEG